VLTSNGPGVAPTFQDAAAGGAWAVLSSGTLSGATELEISVTKNTKVYLFTDSGNESQTLNAQTSADGGSTYATSSGDYSSVYHGIRNETVDSDSQGDNASMVVGYGPSSGDGDNAVDFMAVDMDIIFPAATLSGRYRPAFFSRSMRNHEAKAAADAEPEVYNCWGWRNSTTVFDTIKIYPSVGTLNGSYLILEAN
jgi:hypothetical protein